MELVDQLKHRARRIESQQPETAALLRLSLARIVQLETSLKELAVLGEEGMKPDYREWLTFHDKVAQVARKALRPPDSASSSDPK